MPIQLWRKIDENTSRRDSGAITIMVKKVEGRGKTTGEPYPGRWLLTCSPWFENHDLGMTHQINGVDARAKALDLVRRVLVDALSDFMP